MTELKDSILSLEAALDTAEVFLTSEHSSWGISEISRRTGLQKNRVFRILNTLVKRGYMEKDTATLKYRLGPGFLLLGEAYRRGIDLRKGAEPFLGELAEGSGDAAHLFHSSGSQALCLDVRLGKNVVQAPAKIGELIPLHIGAAPKTLLAFLPEAERSHLIASMPLISYTPKTITNRRELHRVVTEIRSRGYCIACDDFELGSSALAAPVRDHTGHVVAAVSISTPRSRFGRELRRKKLALTLDVARRLSARLGFVGRLADSTGELSPGA